MLIFLSIQDGHLYFSRNSLVKPMITNELIDQIITQDTEQYLQDYEHKKSIN
jgi:hypothetical protein